MNTHLKTLFILFPLIIVLSFSGIIVSVVKNARMAGAPSTTDTAPITIETAREVTGYIKDKDFVSLSNFIDGNVGVLLSPYYASGGNQGRNLTKDDVRNFFSDNQQKLWGYEGGSGRGIQLTNSEYYKKFVYSGDFINMGSESLNISLVSGNTLPLDEVLSEAFKSLISRGGRIQYIEYFIPGFNPKYEGMDWESLALVFMKLNGEWKLIGIFHNQWTI